MYWGSQYNKVKVVSDMQLAIDNQPDYAQSIIVSDIDLNNSYNIIIQEQSQHS